MVTAAAVVLPSFKLRLTIESSSRVFAAYPPRVLMLVRKEEEAVEPRLRAYSVSSVPNSAGDSRVRGNGT